jgi:RsmE family RNA methyltransferase
LLEAVNMIQSLEINPSHVHVATLYGKNVSELLSTQSRSLQDLPTIAFLVGPEGGWSDSEEKKFIDEKYTRFSFGPTVLRAETAGIACALLSTLI